MRRLLAAVLLLLCGNAHAQQLDFKRVSRSGDELLSYRWRDPGKREYTTEFTLTKQAIQQFQLRDGHDPQTYAIGIKELWEIPAANHKPGLVEHTVVNQHRRQCSHIRFGNREACMGQFRP